MQKVVKDTGKILLLGMVLTLLMVGCSAIDVAPTQINPTDQQQIVETVVDELIDSPQPTAGQDNLEITQAAMTQEARNLETATPVPTSMATSTPRATLTPPGEGPDPTMAAQKPEIM